MKIVISKRLMTCLTDYFEVEGDLISSLDFHSRYQDEMYVGVGTRYKLTYKDDRENPVYLVVRAESENEFIYNFMSEMKKRPDVFNDFIKGERPLFTLMLKQIYEDNKKEQELGITKYLLTKYCLYDGNKLVKTYTDKKMALESKKMLDYSHKKDVFGLKTSIERMGWELYAYDKTNPSINLEMRKDIEEFNAGSRQDMEDVANIIKGKTTYDKVVRHRTDLFTLKCLSPRLKDLKEGKVKPQREDEIARLEKRVNELTENIKKYDASIKKPKMVKKKKDEMVK